MKRATIIIKDINSEFEMLLGVDSMKVLDRQSVVNHEEEQVFAQLGFPGWLFPKNCQQGGFRSFSEQLWQWEGRSFSRFILLRPVDV